MDNEALKMLAHFKILLKKEKGLALDLQRLMANQDYARQVFTLAEDSENQTLVTIALTLRDKLGLLKPAPVPVPETATPVAEKAPKVNPDKYKFGARS
jgi:hypothetical protein